MPETNDTPVPMQRVRTTMPLEINGRVEQAGYEMDLTEQAAKEMVGFGRARRVKIQADDAPAEVPVVEEVPAPAPAPAPKAVATAPAVPAATPAKPAG